MPRKNALLVHQLVTDGDMSADIESSPVDIQFLDNVCVQIDITGGAGTGELRVEGSGDGGETYVEIIGLAINGDDTIMIDLNQMGAPKVRVTYENVGGAGVLNAFISGKEV